MKILLVNSNTFREPPTIPVGLEYAASALERAGHEVHVLDMTFTDDPLDSLRRALASERFDLAGVSVRNIDTCQFGRYINFMSHVRDVASALHSAGLRTVLGGSGFSGMPEAILEYTGADFAVVGPADVAFPAFCEKIASDEKNISRFMDGWHMGIHPDAVPVRARHIDYKPYLANGGIIGFATHFGCPERCLYCMESRSGFLPRSPSAVAAELSAFCAQGYDHFHLCDGEFNHDHQYCLDVLDAVANAHLDMRWTAYMKPLPFSAAMLDAMRRANVYHFTLTVDSAETSDRDGKYGWDDVAFIVRGCRDRGIRLAIDLVVGMPDEPPESVRHAVEFFRTERPTSVNVNAWLRVYGGTNLERLLRSRPDLHTHLSASLPPHPPLLEPVFFSAAPMEEIAALVGDDPLFKLEGFDPGTNYEVSG